MDGVCVWVVSMCVCKGSVREGQMVQVIQYSNILIAGQCGIPKQRVNFWFLVSDCHVYIVTCSAEIIFINCTMLAMSLTMCNLVSTLQLCVKRVI